MFTVGLGAGLLSDNVSHTLDAWTEANATPAGRQLPKHLNRAIAVDPATLPTSASVVPATMPAAPQPAWFPPNNQVEWKVAMRPGDLPSGLAIQNASTLNNRILRFFIATGSPAQPWIPAADLYVGAGRQAELKLPRGRYLIQSVTSPTTMPYEQAIRMRPTNIAQVDLLNPEPTGPANLRLTIHPNNQVTQFRLDSVPGRTAAPATVHYASFKASKELPQGNSQQEYASLMAEALND